jgi:radical SAM protein
MPLPHARRAPAGGPAGPAGGPTSPAGPAGPAASSGPVASRGAVATQPDRPVSGRPPAVGAVHPDGYVFARAPMLVYWELTQACGLACRHCRATARPERSPAELSTAEGLRLLDEITAFGRPYPHLVLTGGDPLRRPDLEVLVEAATDRGIGTSLAPAVTPDMTLERLGALRAAGIQTISLSIDGSDAARHDGVRGVPGTFAMTMRAVEWAHQVGLALQINTLVTDETLPDLPAIYTLMTRLGIIRWSLFFLISVGRGTALREISPGASERLNYWLYDLSREAPFAIKTTEATHYRRVAIRRMREEGLDDAAIAATSVGRGFGVRDGNGIMFVAHDGTVFPSGFLPYATGNVRRQPIVTIYRTHPVFTSLRDLSALRGRCGRCPYAAVCGGSRARAFAATGDYLEADPLCPYVPPIESAQA